MVKGKKKDKEEESGIHIDLGLGGIFKRLGGIIESVSKLSSELEDIDTTKTGEIKGLGDKVRGHYGFTVRTMGGGKVKVEPFGNIRKTEKGPVVEEVREPLVDVFDEEKEFKVIAELPGVTEDEIKVGISGDILTISAEGKRRKYHKETLLTAKTKPETMTKSFKNGILEITFAKAQPGRARTKKGMDI